MPAQSTFKATIQRFHQAGEKTGWTYIIVPETEAKKMHSEDKRGFRVQGYLEHLAIRQVALMPMGGGELVLPINAAMRKALALPIGAIISVQLSADHSELTIAADLADCLADEPQALAFFKSLAASHQKYFSKWIEEAKTEATRTRRLAQVLEGLSRKMDYATMIKWGREQRNKL